MLTAQLQTDKLIIAESISINGFQRELKKPFIDIAEEALNCLIKVTGDVPILIVVADDNGNLLNSYSSSDIFIKKFHVGERLVDSFLNKDIFSHVMTAVNPSRLTAGQNNEIYVYGYTFWYKSKLTGSICIAVPSSEYQRHTEALFKMICEKIQNSLESLENTQDNILYKSLAHEMKNALCSINGFSQLLKLKEGNKLLYVDTIINEAERCERLLNEFLLMESCYMFQEVNINTNIKALVEKYMLRYSDKGIRFIIKENYFGLVRGDLKKLMRVFINILDNAVDAIKQEGTVSINIIMMGDQLQINFSDTGCGLLQEDADKIFEAFYTTKDHGTGLGLAYCKKVLIAHGGDINVESQLGKGTTFKVLLPIN